MVSNKRKNEKKKKAKDKRRRDLEKGIGVVVKMVVDGEEDITEITQEAKKASTGPFYKKLPARMKLGWKMRKYVKGE